MDRVCNYFDTNIRSITKFGDDLGNNFDTNIRSITKFGDRSGNYSDTNIRSITSITLPQALPREVVWFSFL